MSVVDRVAYSLGDSSHSGVSAPLALFTLGLLGGGASAFTQVDLDTESRPGIVVMLIVWVAGLLAIFGLPS
ncbi:MAG TPA: hypothetical protein VFH73_00895 [Polyangia bacterium]|nr:hypothetical protein [Polyangia bacterium]